MNSQLQEVFKYRDGRELTTVTVEGEVWFVAGDVCDILETSNSARDISRLEDDEKLMYTMCIAGQNRRLWLINESGLYALVMTSRKPEAKAFKRWVTHEVLPSIRKNGMYATEELLDNPDLLIQVATKLRDERQARLAAEAVVAAQTVTLEEQKPKVEFYNTVADSKEAFTMEKVSKMLGIKGVGRNNLYKILREKKILLDSNAPRQQYMNQGYFRVREVTVRRGFDINIEIQTLVYQKGIQFISKVVNEYLEESKSNRNFCKA